MKQVFFLLFLMLTITGVTAQTSKPHFSPLKDNDIDSLAKDSLVLNEFKVINYCQCLKYLKIQEISLENKNRKPENKLAQLSSNRADYAYFGAGNPFSSHIYESSRSFFRFNAIDSGDFIPIIEKYFEPIVSSLTETSDYRILSDYSPMFECFYAVEKMPLRMELKSLLLRKRPFWKLQIVAPK